MIDTWAEAHDTGSSNKLSGDEKDEIWEWMQRNVKSPLTLKAAREKTNGRGG